jgi:hypothetical protein
VNAPSRFKDLCLDAQDHQAVAEWWCQAMGYRRHIATGEPRPVSDPVPIIDPTGAGPLLWVVPVPEEKMVKNRMHLDVVGDVDALLGLGAVLVQRLGEDRDWDVLADPEGSEFCVFAP